MNLFILRIVFLGSSVQPQKAWAYKQEVTITDQQKGTNQHLLQMNRISATKPAAPRSPLKPLLPIATQIYKPVAAPKKPVLNPSTPHKPSNPVTKPTKRAKLVLPPSHFDGRSEQLNPTQPFKPSSPVKPFKPSSPIQPMKPVQPLAKPAPPPFDGGINTAVNWYCGNQTAKTCSSQMCTDPITGCSQNRNNYRDCLWECIPVPTARPMRPSAKPATTTPSSKPLMLNPILSFGGGINTPVNWYCGNVTTNTCDPGRIACSDPTNGCSNNRNNYRSCLFECINGTFG